MSIVTGMYVPEAVIGNRLAQYESSSVYDQFSAEPNQQLGLFTPVVFPPGAVAVLSTVFRARQELSGRYGTLYDILLDVVRHRCRITIVRLSMNFFERVEKLWQNPGDVNLSECFIYYIVVTNNKNEKFNYVGKARNSSRLKEYRNNMLKIKHGKERGKTQGYRAVHFALYSALENNWEIDFPPLENCSKENLNLVENKKIAELKCNLNGGKTWRISGIGSLVLADLLR